MDRARPRRSSPRSSQQQDYRSEAVVTTRAGFDQLEGRNVVLEGLLAERALVEVAVDEGARPRGALEQVLQLCEQRGVRLVRMPRQRLDRVSLSGSHNGVIAWARPRPEASLKEVLVRLLSGDRPPFLLLLDQVQYEQNLGALLRTAESAGVQAVLVPRSHAAPLSPLVRRISAGASEHLELVRVSTMAALKELKRAGVLIVGADEHSPVGFDETDMSGAVALVMGGEHKGLSEPVRKRCDALVSLPMRGRIPSLNVSVAGALLMYEKVRQERAMARERG